VIWLDLLRDRDFVRYQRNPGLLYDQALSALSPKSSTPRWIVIDLRTKDDAEIDLVIEKPGDGYILIKIKSTQNASAQHGKHVRAFSQELPKAEAWVVSLDEQNRKEGDLIFLHWQAALTRLFPELKETLMRA
jgi:hypothetical protein